MTSPNVDYFPWTDNLEFLTLGVVETTSLSIAQANLAVNLKKARKELGMTQEELAFQAGIDRTYASQIERAIANPSLAIICSLADVLKCNYMDLVGASTNK